MDPPRPTQTEGCYFLCIPVFQKIGKATASWQGGQDTSSAGPPCCHSHAVTAMLKGSGGSHLLLPSQIPKGSGLLTPSSGLRAQQPTASVTGCLQYRICISQQFPGNTQNHYRRLETHMDFGLNLRHASRPSRQTLRNDRRRLQPLQSK